MLLAFFSSAFDTTYNDVNSLDRRSCLPFVHVFGAAGLALLKAEEQGCLKLTDPVMQNAHPIVIENQWSESHPLGMPGGTLNRTPKVVSSLVGGYNTDLHEPIPLSEELFRLSEEPVATTAIVNVDGQIFLQGTMDNWRRRDE